MNLATRFQVRHIRWWHRPVPLIEDRKGEFVQVGWAWNQWAYLVKNISMGWIAFVDGQTPENLNIWKCDNCGAHIGPSQQRRIQEFVLSKEAEDAS